MSITSADELQGMQRVSEAVANTLKQMREFARPGISTKELDDFGGKILADYGAKSAPKLTYGFPGWTCISLNNEAAHGIPAEDKILANGDLVNIDVSALSLMVSGPIMVVLLFLEKTLIIINL
ncbi:M24 family metallopeptidase [Pedobacter sp. NJ-S-72]